MLAPTNGFKGLPGLQPAVCSTPKSCENVSLGLLLDPGAWLVSAHWYLGMLQAPADGTLPTSPPGRLSCSYERCSQATVSPWSPTWASQRHKERAWGWQRVSWQLCRDSHFINTYFKGHDKCNPINKADLLAATKSEQSRSISHWYGLQRSNVAEVKRRIGFCREQIVKWYSAPWINKRQKKKGGGAGQAGISVATSQWR